jgi:1,4-alpha-glucan branching enzyme
MRFIAFIQNHDQVGNRALGDRLSAIAPAAAVRAVTAVYLLLPQIPMLFMGEEWHSSRPFQFFCDFGGELADAVREGRRQEFSRFAAFQSESARASIPDPQATETFQASKLDWEALHNPRMPAPISLVPGAVETRATHIVPLLPILEARVNTRVIAERAAERALEGHEWHAIDACWRI